MSTAVREGGDTGVPIVVSAPDSPQGQAFKKIASNVVAQLRVAGSKGKGLPVIDMSDTRGDQFKV
jgi:ATP-binding protein involved in chromosome partitioning